MALELSHIVSGSSRQDVAAALRAEREEAKRLVQQRSEAAAALYRDVLDLASERRAIEEKARIAAALEAEKARADKPRQDPQQERPRTMGEPENQPQQRETYLERQQRLAKERGDPEIKFVREEDERDLERLLENERRRWRNDGNRQPG